MASTTDTDFAVAVAYNTLDMVKAFKLDRLGWLGRASAGLFRSAASQITDTAFQYDRRVGLDGLALSSAWLVERFTHSVDIIHLPHIPPGQPLLIASNHPGVIDAMVVFAAVQHPDLRIIAAERPILRLLPNIARHLIFLPDDPTRRLGAVRTATNHLRDGGAVLTFPAGKIEPDPALYPDAEESLAGWSGSLDLFVRLVPDLLILPVAVSGVISHEALRHPITRLYRSPRQQSWVAATLQLILPRYHNVCVTAHFGTLIHAAEALYPVQEVTAQMRQLLQNALRP